MSFVYVHMIEMTVFEEEVYELPYTLLGRVVDIIRVTKEPLSRITEIDMLDAWFKLNPFGLSGVSDTLECAAKLMGGEEHVYTRCAGGSKATLSLTTYKQELWE